LTDTPVKNELAQKQRQKARKGSSEKESVGQVPSCLTALFGSSRKHSVARSKKKAATKPSALLMLRKMTHHAFTAESCIARLAKSYGVGFAVKAAV